MCGIVFTMQSVAQPIRHLRTFLVMALLATACGPFRVPAQTGASARLIASPEPDWPQWRGPRRDGVCEEGGLLSAWPEGGPKLLWKIDALGQGYACPIITGGSLYITGDVGTNLIIQAYDLTGKRLWQTANGRSWTGPYPGARACCTYSDGHLYQLNAHGRLVCLEAKRGRERWSVNILERFAAKNLTWAISECVVVRSNQVIVTPGGTQALMAALDKKTGDTIWTTGPLRYADDGKFQPYQRDDQGRLVDAASYASPILFELGGRQLLASCSQQHVFCVDADRGQLLWRHPLTTKYQVLAATPVLVGDSIFATGPDAVGGILLGLRWEGDQVRSNPQWISTLDTCHGGVVKVGDTLIGSGYHNIKGWACVDIHTGKERYRTPKLDMGSVLYADGLLYCLSQRGDMALLKCAPNGFEFKGQFRLVKECKNDMWTHPVIHAGRLYLRYHDSLFCYDIRR